MARPAGVAVADASCVIGLHAIGQLDLLCRVYAHVVIPIAVWSDLEASGGSPESRTLAALTCVRIQAPRAIPALPPSLHDGERQVIALARELGADHALLDDLEARRTAAALSLPVAGTLRVLLRAKEIGLLTALKPQLDGLLRAGFYLSDGLIHRVLAAAGEADEP